MSLPAVITRYVESAMLQARRPAWIEVDADGRVRDFGGDLGAYGLDGVREGANAEDHAVFLVGQLPVDSGVEVLPVMRQGSGEAAEVHLVRDKGRTWALLLSAAQTLSETSVTQQQRLELSLGLREELQRDANGFADALGVLVLVRRSDDRFRAFARVPGWARSLWRDGAVHVAEEVFPFLDSFLDEADDIWSRRRAGMLRSGAWTQPGPRGTELHLEATATCLAPLGEVLMIELLGDEYWSRQRMLQLARDRRLALDRLVREQDQREILLHCIVHDLKGPLAGIQGSIDLAAGQPGLGDDARDLLQNARRACRKQLGLIEDIVSVFRHGQSGAERKRRSGVIEPLDVVELAWNVHRDYQPAFLSAGRRLVLEVPPGEARLPVRGDERRFERVLANLLDNALRYTPVDGTTTLRVREVYDEAHVSVENEGESIPLDRQESLFSHFGVHAGRGGTAGLGLYYCRITVERWGGSIAHEDRPGGGSVFTFRLPLLPA